MLVDAHSHLDKYADDDLSAVLAALEEQRILTFSVSVDPPSFVAAEAIADCSDRVVATFGVHPWQAPEWVDRLDELDPLIERSPMIGEIGLDHRFVEDAGLYGAQRTVFCHFLERAGQQGKVVNVHCAGAENETLELLTDFGCPRGIIHWYSGPLDVLERMITAGYLFTVGVEVLVSDHIRRVAERIPAEQLLTETDNPGGLRWLTGEMGMPEHLTEVVAEIARLKDASAEWVESTVHDNMRRLISDVPSLRALTGPP